MKEILDLLHFHGHHSTIPPSRSRPPPPPPPPPPSDLYHVGARAIVDRCDVDRGGQWRRDGRADRRASPASPLECSNDGTMVAGGLPGCGLLRRGGSRAIRGRHARCLGRLSAGTGRTTPDGWGGIVVPRKVVGRREEGQRGGEEVAWSAGEREIRETDREGERVHIIQHSMIRTRERERDGKKEMGERRNNRAGGAEEPVSRTRFLRNDRSRALSKVV